MIKSFKKSLAALGRGISDFQDQETVFIYIYVGEKFFCDCQVSSAKNAVKNAPFIFPIKDSDTVLDLKVNINIGHSINK